MKQQCLMTFLVATALTIAVSAITLAQSTNSNGTTKFSYSLSLKADTANLSSKIALAAEDEPGEKMIISGTVYDSDAVTPAKNAVLYLYQTDVRGIYSDEECNNGCPKLRGYLKTDANGKYEISTIKPGHYPHIKAPAHIHVHVKAANQPEYQVTFFFYDDSLITAERRARTDTLLKDFGLIKLMPDDKGVLRGIHSIKPPLPPTSPQNTNTDTVVANPQLEQELRKIMLEMIEDLHHGSIRVFNRYRADNLISTSEAGDAEVMHPLEKKPIELADVQVREYGETVVMNFRELDRVELKNQKFTRTWRKTVVFMKRDTSWQMISYHSSPAAFERVVAAVDPKILDAYVGQYKNPLWGIYNVTREGDTIVFTSSNSYRTEYLPESETEFFNKDEQSRQEMLQTLSFVRNGKGKVTHCIFRENDGQNIVVKKIR